VRSTLWDFCRSRWGSRGVVPVESPSPPGRFNRGAAINAALADDDWDVALIVDADVVVDVDQAARAVERARTAGTMVLAFHLYVGLAPWGTRDLLRTGDLETAREGRLRVVRDHESSAVAVSRSVFRRVGGFDERLVGWGVDDVAFCQSVRVLCGPPIRERGTVYHLWHEAATEKRPSDPGWIANQALGARYRAATDPAAMEALIWERTAPSSSATSTPAIVGTGRRG